MADLRAAMEEAARARIDEGDGSLVLIPGAEVLTAAHLADGIHPGDEGQARLAQVFGAAIAAAVAAVPAAPHGGDVAAHHPGAGPERWPGRRRWSGW